MIAPKQGAAREDQDRGKVEARLKRIGDAALSSKAHVTLHNATTTPSGIKLRWRQWDGNWAEWRQHTIAARGRAHYEEIGVIDLEIEFDRIAGNGKYDRHVERYVDVDRYPAHQKLTPEHGRHHSFYITPERTVELRAGRPKS